MKLDVKTIKSLMDNFNESARSDAMRHMRRGSGVDPADVDTSASDDYIKSADKNIIMQMRKAQSLRGRFAVEFGDRKKIKIPEKIAVAVQQKYNSLRKPVDKEKFQSRVAKSYKDMLAAIKESTVQESILERVNRQINEIKELREASNRWILANKKFSLVNDKGTYILVSQGTGKETKLKAKTPQDATQELVKKGYREY